MNKRHYKPSLAKLLVYFNEALKDYGYNIENVLSNTYTPHLNYSIMFDKIFYFSKIGRRIVKVEIRRDPYYYCFSTIYNEKFRCGEQSFSDKLAPGAPPRGGMVWQLKEYFHGMGLLSYDEVMIKDIIE